MSPILDLGLKLAVLCFTIAGAAQFLRFLYRRARTAWDRRVFLRRRVTLEQVAEFAESGCKHCHGTGVLQRYTGPKSPKYPIPCSCASRAFMKVHEADTRMLGQFRIWKLGRGPRRGPVARDRPGVAAARAA
jgi:hypothetical protein